MGKLSSAKAMADSILMKLAQGKGGEVTDDMMAQADDFHLYNNYDLPMDEASRMGRAADMGFDVEAYHGTGADFQGFDGDMSDSRRQTGTPKGAFVFTDQFENANSYASRQRGDYGRGGSVMPVVTRGSKEDRANVTGKLTADLFFDDFEAKRSSGSEFSGHINGLATAAQGDGYDRLFVDGVVDTADQYYTPQTTQFVFDPTNIRSRFARFDPRLSHLKNLSAGVGGLGLLGLANQGDKQ